MAPLERVPDGEEEFYELTAADAAAAAAGGAEEGAATRAQRLPPPIKSRGAEVEVMEAAFRAGVEAALRVDSGRDRGGGRGPGQTTLRRRHGSNGSRHNEDEDEEEEEGSSDSLLSDSDEDKIAAEAAADAAEAAAAARHAAKLNPAGAFWRRDVATGQVLVHVPARSAPPTGAMQDVTDLSDVQTPVPKRYAKPHADPHGRNPSRR